MEKYDTFNHTSKRIFVGPFPIRFFPFAFRFVDRFFFFILLLFNYVIRLNWCSVGLIRKQSKEAHTAHASITPYTSMLTPIFGLVTLLVLILNVGVFDIYLNGALICSAHAPQIYTPGHARSASLWRWNKNDQIPFVLLLNGFLFWGAFVLRMPTHRMTLCIWATY